MTTPREKKRENAYGDYRVGLVDDDPVFLDSTVKLVKRILERNNIFCTIEAFGSAGELLKAVYAGFRYDVLFLDILMKGMDGMSLAGQLRATGANTPIVFLTSSQEYALDGYRVQARHYLLKPVQEGDLETLLLAICRKKSNGDDAFLVVHYQRQYGKVPLEEIEYIEQVGRKVAVHTQTGEELVSSDTLNAIQDMLPLDAFVRCHQGYVVNIRHAALLEGPYLEMRSGCRIPISRSRRKAVKLAFFENMKHNHPAT